MPEATRRGKRGGGGCRGSGALLGAAGGGGTLGWTRTAGHQARATVPILPPGPQRSFSEPVARPVKAAWLLCSLASGQTNEEGGASVIRTPRVCVCVARESPCSPPGTLAKLLSSSAREGGGSRLTRGSGQGKGVAPQPPPGRSPSGVPHSKSTQGPPSLSPCAGQSLPPRKLLESSLPVFVVAGHRLRGGGPQKLTPISPFRLRAGLIRPACLPSWCWRGGQGRVPGFLSKRPKLGVQPLDCGDARKETRAHEATQVLSPSG